MIAPAAQADEQSLARIARISGSERLRLFADGKLLETGHASRSAVAQMKKGLETQGFYHDLGTPRVIATETWAAPIISYDGNINGGVLQDSFTFNGLVFEADPAFRAKGGVVMGLSAGGVVRLAWDNGRYVEGLVRAEGVWSPRHKVGRSTAELALCSRNHVTGWSFLDLCYNAAIIDRELGTSTAQDVSLSATQLFQTSAGYHELTAELSGAHYDTGRQTSVTLSWSAVWDGVATKLSLTHAAPIPGETALNSRIAADVKWLWSGRTMGLGLWHQRSGGGAFLGAPRADDATGVKLSYQLRQGLTAQVGYMTNQSSVDFFDYAQASVTFRFDNLRW
ncbi:MAG: hypothetical protein Q7J57_05000 [Gemmobacter sp.]|nr:hypothetical protein [Gemmobacter sp.]